jgi:hypothetical protein
MIKKLDNCKCKENKKLYSEVNELLERVNIALKETDRILEEEKQRRKK